jgi:DNA-binding NtrC family response regulator
LKNKANYLAGQLLLITAHKTGSEAAMKTVLIVDSDLGFVFWLGQELDAAGYRAFPARSVTDATALLGELKIGVDLLIVNPALPHAAGFVETLGGSNNDLKVVAVSDNESVLDIVRNIDRHCRKPKRMDESARSNLISEIECVLAPFEDQA